MSNIGNAARTAQALGITASGLAAGNIFNYSFVLVPTLLLPGAGGPKRTFDSSEQPGTPISHIATQWRHSYSAGKGAMPLISLVASSAFTYAAHSFRNQPARNVSTSNMYLLAAALALGPIPYTLLFMHPTNKKLLARAEMTDSEGIGTREKTEIRASKEETEVMDCLKTWSSMNVVRALFPLSATLVGLCATLCAIE